MAQPHQWRRQPIDEKKQQLDLSVCMWQLIAEAMGEDLLGEIHSCEGTTFGGDRLMHIKHKTASVV